MALVALASTMVIVIGAQVFFRYVLNNSLFWSEELGRVLLIWLSFIGAAVAFKAQAHVGVDVVFRRFSPAVKKLSRLLMLTGCAVFFFVMLYWGSLFTSMISGQMTASLGIGKHVPFLIIPVSGAIMLLHTIAMFFETLTHTPRFLRQSGQVRNPSAKWSQSSESATNYNNHHDQNIPSERSENIDCDTSGDNGVKPNTKQGGRV